ncbi:MAG TPA: response regulator [Pyrinomonadaceae bacterium]|nr:response regulator [Pyrinomonadaceae bacterium]
MKPNAKTRRPSVFVVEDDDDNRLMMKVMLGMRGYRVVEARDGEEALRLMDGDPPCLILTDLQLPRLNGFALARRVRRTPELSRVPIIVVSGHDPALHRPLAIAAGCDEYLFKPFDFDSLETTIERLLLAA